MTWAVCLHYAERMDAPAWHDAVAEAERRSELFTAFDLAEISCEPHGAHRTGHAPGAVYVTEAFAAALELAARRDFTCAYAGQVPAAKDYGSLRCTAPAHQCIRSKTRGGHGAPPARYYAALRVAGAAL